ncbi:MAG: hypothetical protein LBK04_03275 [Clostridiales Family XIII bacterium]|jgi:hypothetical protein|nr:hypothetical protein [Clostridiales Family XIII bacterium]
MRTRLFRPPKTSIAVKASLFVVALIAAILLIGWSVGHFEESRDEQHRQIVEDAIVRAAVQCYAIESRYPPGLEYLVDNYGIVLDEDKYIYHYRATGGNLLPEVNVFEKKTGFAFAVGNGDGGTKAAEG